MCQMHVIELVNLQCFSVHAVASLVVDLRSSPRQLVLVAVCLPGPDLHSEILVLITLDVFLLLELKIVAQP
jgi:hypothetical protein